MTNTSCKNRAHLYNTLGTKCITTPGSINVFVRVLRTWERVSVDLATSTVRTYRSTVALFIGMYKLLPVVASREIM